MRGSTLTLVVVIAVLPTAALGDDAVLPYTKAILTGSSFECAYRMDTFFGDTEPFRAQIRGTSFRAVSAQEFDPDTKSFRASFRPFGALLAKADIHYWRLGDIAYLLRVGEPPALMFDLDAMAEAGGVPVSNIVGSIFYSPIPPPTASCQPISGSPPLELPDGTEFTDMTQAMIEQFKKQSDLE